MRLNIILITVLTLALFSGCTKQYYPRVKEIAVHTRLNSSHKITYTIKDRNITLARKDFRWLLAKSNRGWRNTKKLQLVVDSYVKQIRNIK